MRKFIFSIAIFIGTTCSAESDVGVVCHIKVLSDKVEDVSSIDAWKKSFIKEGMSDEQKALAVWQTVVKFRHQDPPPIEYLTGDGGDVHDPIKTFNVYGYNMCCCESSNIIALARAAGLEARGWGINAHSVPEIKYGGAWHLFDASLVCYFRKPDHSVAGVEDILGGIDAWYVQHPEFRRNNDKLYKFMGGGNWKNGPPILASTDAYDPNGWLPAATHGWYSTMQEYDGRGGGKDNKAFLYQYGYSQGYEVNIRLRPGERLTRNWSNTGLHINMDGAGPAPGALTEKVGQNNQLRYSAKLGDLANERIGNGSLEYLVPLTDSKLANSVLSLKNFETAGAKQSPVLRVSDAKAPAELIIEMPSSYVYLDGTVALTSVVGEGGGIAVSLSDNNGLDWKDVAKISESGERTLPLKALIFRRYSYRVKIVAQGKGTGLNALKFSSTIQHSQRPLPALAQGENTISFSAGPAESTVTTEASAGLEHKDKQLTVLDFHPVIEGVDPARLVLTGGAGSITFPLETPGTLTRLRFGSFYRARDERDGWDYEVSFDAGKTWKAVAHAPGLTGNGACLYVMTEAIPPNTRKALLRFSGKQRNTTMISNFRIDADYAAPHGGFRPIQITYRWEESGIAKEDVHIAHTADEKYILRCAQKPTMKAILLELTQ